MKNRIEKMVLKEKSSVKEKMIKLMYFVVRKLDMGDESRMLKRKRYKDKETRMEAGVELRKPGGVKRKVEDNKVGEMLHTTITPQKSRNTLKNMPEMHEIDGTPKIISVIDGEKREKNDQYVAEHVKDTPIKEYDPPTAHESVQSGNVKHNLQAESTSETPESR